MQISLVLIWLAICAAQDVRQRRISNVLTLGVGALALVWLLATGSTWLGSDAGQGGWACLIALLLTLPGYFLGRMGAGDVKLMTALGLATNGIFVLGAFIGAGVASVLWLLLAPKVWPLMGQGLTELLRHLAPDKSKKLPFAPFVWVGVVLSWYWIT